MPAVVLTVIRKGHSRTFRFKKDVITLGRSPECVLALDDQALSRTHCQLERQGESLWVRDLNSRNGTLVGGEAVKRRRLDKGDIVHVGNVRVVFEGISEHADADDLGRRTLALFRRRTRSQQALKSAAEQNERLHRLLSIVREVVEELDQDRVLSRIIDTAVDLAGAERGFLLVFRGEDLSVEVARNYWRKDVDDPEFEVSRSIAQQVRNERRSLIVEDASEDVAFNEYLSVHALQLRSVLCVPLIFRGDVKGTLYLDNRFTRGSFVPEDRDILESFADVAAIALENSGRFGEERLRNQDLLAQVAQGRSELQKVQRALDAKRSDQQLRYGFENVVAESEAMKRVLRTADRLIPSTIPVILQGPTGVGKERMARIIHANGPNAEGPFLALACAALPASLAEVELFGHGPGAFTGAGEGRGGILEEAAGGTLYLENLDDLEPETQAIFLRVLETGEFRRVGESKPRLADVRIIGGTAVALEPLVRAGRFREDLYFRLKAATLVLPELSQRPEDLPKLLEQFLREEAPTISLSPRARKALLQRPWPGNLLEMRNEVRRLATLGELAIDVEDLGPIDPPESELLKDAVAKLEQRMIRRSLNQHQGNLTRTAESLGLSRLGLRKKMERYGIEKP